MTAWTATEMRLPEGTERPPAGLADQWRENGKTEHASVAAFARLTLDLMALGAPPALIAAVPKAQRVGTLPRSRRLALEDEEYASALRNLSDRVQKLVEGSLTPAA